MRAFGTAVLLAGSGAAAQGQVPRYSLTLGDAARLGAERSSAVQQAQTRVEGAEARIREQTGALLPNLNADVLRGDRTFNSASFGIDFPTAPGQQPLFDPEGQVIGPIGVADLRARLEMPLLDLAALGRRRGAQAGAAAAEEELSGVEQVAATVAARAYVAVLWGNSEAAAREEDLALAMDLLEVARGQLEAGVAVALDVTRAEAQVATVRAQRLAATHRAQSAELAFRRALRIEESADLELTDNLNDAMAGQVPGEDESVAAALDRRGDLRTAEAYQAVAHESVSALKAGRLPRVTASLDDGYTGRTYGGRLLNTYTWGLRVSLPVFDGFQRSARIQQEEARARELAYHIEDLEADVTFQVRQALLNVHAAQEQVAATAERLRLAELEVAQEEERLRAGVSGTADLVRAALRLSEARTADMDTRASVLLARVALASATGSVTELR